MELIYNFFGKKKEGLLVANDHACAVRNVNKQNKNSEKFTKTKIQKFEVHEHVNVSKEKKKKGKKGLFQNCSTLKVG